MAHALKDRKWTAAIEQTGKFKKLPPAVVVDIDETVVDNAPAQLREILNPNAGYRATWDPWVEEARAAPLAGALEFVKYAVSKQVKEFFITNRPGVQRAATMRNLERAGFPVSDDTLITRSGSPDKSQRRAAVAAKYRILLLVGDDLGDFLPSARTSMEEREKRSEEYRSWWGERWIILPNPMYGSWEVSARGGENVTDRRQILKNKMEAVKTLQNQ